MFLSANGQDGNGLQLEEVGQTFQVAHRCVLRPIYTVRFLLTIVACDFCSARCSRHGKIVYDFYDIKLPVATIVVGF